VQGKRILITGMAPDLSYDNTCSERLNVLGNEMEIEIDATDYIFPCRLL